MMRLHRWLALSFVATLLIGATAGSVLAQSGSTTRPAGRAAAATRPAQAIPWIGCITAECHASIRFSKVLHGPVASNHCEACHELADAATHHFKLIREKEQVCTYCHEFRGAKMLPVVHTPVKRGECLGCHDPHGGATPELLREATIQLTCERCHDSVADGRAFLHAPVKDGACNSCHAPHASRYPKLLDTVGTDLCLTCHVQFASSLAGASVRHKALDQGCEKCHDAHGSNHPMATTQPVVGQCGGCHEKTITLATDAAVKHAPVTEGRACMSCHTPHGGPYARLLKSREEATCLACHAQPLKDPRGRTLAAMTEFVSPGLSKHGAMKDGTCCGCHAPHGADRPQLLIRPLSRTFYQFFNARSYELCFGCHDPKLATEPRTSKHLTAFRDGDRNLHFVHVNNGWRSHGCIACHDSHGTAGNDRGVRDRIVFGAWQMPMRFERTATGGRCTPGCHVAYAYDRDQPVRPTTAPTTLPSIEPPMAPSSPVLIIARDRHGLPSSLRFTATRTDGRELIVPQAKRTTLLVLVRADQTDQIDVDLDGLDVDPVFVISGKGQFMDRGPSPQRLPAIRDPDGDLAAALGTSAWPTALLVGPDGACLARVAGDVRSLPVRLRSYLDQRRGTASTPATTQPTVGAGPERQRTRQLRVARDLLRAGHAEQACAILRDAARSAALPADAQLDLVNALLQLDRLDDAASECEKLPASSLRPGERVAISARLLIAKGRWNEARATMLEALQRDPGCRAAHLLMGRIYEHEQDWPRAAAEYRTSAEPAPPNNR